MDVVRSIASRKETLIKVPILNHYEIILEKGTTECGLDSSLFQEGKPVAYASRALAETEKNAKKKCKPYGSFVLVTFHHYKYGRHISVDTDHKTGMKASHLDLRFGSEFLVLIHDLAQGFGTKAVHRRLAVLSVLTQLLQDVRLEIPLLVRFAWNFIKPGVLLQPFQGAHIPPSL